MDSRSIEISQCEQLLEKSAVDLKTISLKEIHQLLKKHKQFSIDTVIGVFEKKGIFNHAQCKRVSFKIKSKCHIQSLWKFTDLEVNIVEAQFAIESKVNLYCIPLADFMGVKYQPIMWRPPKKILLERFLDSVDPKNFHTLNFKNVREILQNFPKDLEKVQKHFELSLEFFSTVFSDYNCSRFWFQYGINKFADVLRPNSEIDAKCKVFDDFVFLEIVKLLNKNTKRIIPNDQEGRELKKPRTPGVEDEAVNLFVNNLLINEDVCDLPSLTKR